MGKMDLPEYFEAIAVAHSRGCRSQPRGANYRAVSMLKSDYHLTCEADGSDPKQIPVNRRCDRRAKQLA
jgi:hypothetical protein